MPTSEDALLRELLATFQAEAVEHLQTLNQALLQLERLPEEAQRQKLLQDAFRAAHSLKGAARAVSLQEIEALSHAMESVLQAARDANLALDASTCDVLYDSLDAIQALLDGKTVALDAIREKLAAAGGGAARTAGIPAARTPPVAAPDIPPPAPAVDSAADASPEIETPHTVARIAASAEETIRVSVDKLDNLMAQAGELLVSRISAEQRLAEMRDLRQHVEAWPRTWREIKALLPHVGGDIGLYLNELLERHYAHLQDLSRDIELLDRAINHDASRLGMVANQLQDEVRRVRMVPFQQIVLPLERAVRDAAHSEGKQAKLVVEGSDVELDKKILEMLKDPLLHLLRNAVGHGIEAPPQRAAAGKPAEGLVSIAVQPRGSEIRITVADDGRGFDLDGLRATSARYGGPRLDENAGAEEVIALAFLPGMSTASKVTAMSGRGVGLDVVRQQLESLQGRVEVTSETGAGTTFCLTVPSSLMMTRGLIVRVGRRQFVVPLLAVQKILPPHDIVNVEGQPMLMVDGAPLPLVTLATVLSLPAGTADDDPEKALAIVLGVAELRIAVLVDDVLTEQELAVKTLGKPLQRVRNVTGAALMGDGKPVIVLNPADLVKSARGSSAPAYFLHRGELQDAGPPAHILVVDDSITTRTLEKNILEAAGYLVTIATDGLEAVKRLQETAIDLVVSDVQMPVMDGIELTSHLRETDAHMDLPIILVTSLESHEDRERGMLAGANAYIVKRGFDQAELLATIQQYLG